MIRALLLAYHFPPIGGAGAQRWLKLARYLPECGVAVTVVSGPGSSTGRWSPRDESLLSELPAETVVQRVTSVEPLPSNRWRARAERWLGLQSPWSQWWVDGAVREGLSVGTKTNVVIASMSPYASATAAAKLSRATGIAWIADLRDPWALDEMMIFPTRLHQHLELNRMGRLLATSAAVVTTTPEAARRIRVRFPELAATPIESIPNGYDASDFVDPLPQRRDDAFRIVHTGYLHTDLGERQRRTARMRAILGGEVRGVDILTRSHVYLLEAIDQLTTSEPALGSLIELHLAGALSESDHEVAERYPFVRIHGYVSHAEAVQLMRTADLLFLPMQKLAPGSRSSIVPGKTYEYLAAQRPILGAVPEGDARDILRQSGIARLCSPDDPAGMASAIKQEIERKRSGDPSSTIPDGFLERFERRELAAKYADLLDSVAGR